MAGFIKDLEYLKEVMITKNYSVWRVSDSAQKLTVFGFAEDISNPSEAYNELKKCIDNLDGVVTIKLMSKKFENKEGGDTSKTLTYQFHAGNSTKAAAPVQQQTAINSPGMQGAPGYYELLQENFNLKLDAKINALKKELAPETQDAKAQMIKANYQAKIADRILGILEGGKTAPAPQKINQAAPITDNATDQDEIKKSFINNLQKLGKNDPNFYKHIEKLTELQETNPDIYKLAIDALYNF